MKISSSRNFSTNIDLITLWLSSSIFNKGIIQFNLNDSSRAIVNKLWLLCDNFKLLLKTKNYSIINRMLNYAIIFNCIKNTLILYSNWFYPLNLFKILYLKCNFIYVHLIWLHIRTSKYMKNSQNNNFHFWSIFLKTILFSAGKHFKLEESDKIAKST